MELAHTSWPFFDATHREFAGAFDMWVTRQLAVFETDDGGDGVAARDILRQLGAAGWLQMTIPTDKPDPTRPDLRTMCLAREIAAHSSAIADVAISEPWLGILPLALFGSPELRGEYLPRYVSGDLLPAFALSEPGAGSDAAAIECRARLSGNHYVINGCKTWTSNCGLADLYIVFARTGDDGGAKGISAFAVDAADPGIRLEERLHVLSPHTVGTWTLDNVKVPADRMIGLPGDGFKIAMAVLELFRPTVAAASLGLARRAMDEAVKHSLERRTFGKPLAEHQLVQAKLADMAVGIDAAALLTYRAGWVYDSSNNSITRHAAIAKLFGSEMAFKIIDQAVQIFGGLGMVRGKVVERLFRHSRAFRIFDGASEIQHLIIARDVLRRAGAA